MHRAVGLSIAVCVSACLGLGASAQAQSLGSLSKLKRKAQDAKKKTEESKPEGSKAGDGTKGDEASSTTTPADQAKKPAAVAQSGGQPDMTAVKIEFVPGERTLFFDDFSDMAPDEPPPHWKVRGGTVSLKLGGGEHELAPADGVHLTSPKINVPKNFTFEIVCNCDGEIEWGLEGANNDAILSGSFQESENHTSVSTRVHAKEDLGDGEIKTQPGKLLTFALWAQQGRVRAYLNGERVVDANQVDFSGIDHIAMQASRYRYTGIRSVRLAESAPDVSSTLASTGKYVTHGIYFDTDSDRLQPESAPVLRQIAGALIKNPSLKLTVVGYTDSTGNADHNVDLSKRRAEAVRAVLVSQFSIDASRLMADGKGATEPLASNDTADGRAQNRRVEFVKK